MKFLKIILVISFFIFLSCEELNWTDEDVFKEKENIKKELQMQSIIKIYNEIAKDTLNTDTKLSNDSISKSETII